MSKKDKKKTKNKYRPYEVVKQKFVKFQDPFGDAPMDVRRRVMLEIATKAKTRFDTEYPKIIEWIERYDPLYILSFCVLYFLSAPQGVDKEAIEGKLDFAHHHLELLQAFALMRPRTGTPEPLRERAMELQRWMKELTDDLGVAQLAAVTEGATDSEVKKHFVINEMRSQTFAIRNWAFPEQAIAHLKALFGGRLNEIIGAEYGGVSAPRLIEVLERLAEQIGERLNAHIGKLRPALRATSFDEVYREYRKEFSIVKDDTEGMRRVFTTMCGGNIRSFKSLLMAQSDLFLADVFTFTSDEIVQAYGDESRRDGLIRIFGKWSHRFDELAGRNPHHFLYSNPVLAKPFIQIGDNSFFWALAGIMAHTLPAMLEQLVPGAGRQRYSDTRAAYLEDTAEALFREAFPDGHVFRGSQWRPTPGDPVLYENDVLVVIDSTAIVIECKSHMVDAPARRGAEFRLIDTLEDLIVSASDQAQRFVDFLKGNRQRHQFTTVAGGVNGVDSSRLVRFIPISVTYENLGFVSANLKDAVAAGLIETGHSLVPSICLTDLEVIFEILDSQAQRIHYLARRAETEKTMLYHGDEIDLLAFYVETGFNIGDVEDGSMFVNMAMKSKELDPYFVARADGIDVPKPALQLTEWWKDILERIESVKSEFWTEIAYIFLSVQFQDQKKCQRQFERLADRVEAGRLPDKHNWMVFISGTRSKRQYAVIVYPYTTRDRIERNDMMKHMAADTGEKIPVLGIAVMGLDLNALHYPYNVLAYVPGHAPGAPEIAHLRRIRVGN